VSDATPEVGDAVTFTVILSNAGPDPATNVTLTDILPAGLTFLGATPSRGSYASDTGIWVVGTVVPGAPQTLQIEARVDSPASQTNTATVTAADQFDPDTNNNTASASLNPEQADLALTKTVSNPRPNVGDTITYTVTLTDNGPNDATGIEVDDLLPSGLALVGSNPSVGSYNPATGLWSVASLAHGARATLTLTAHVVSPDAQTNTATIGAADQFDPDTTNNTASSTATPQQADLAITKTVNNPRPNVGDTITFVVMVMDNGPDAAANVRVTDLLPSGLTFISATPGQGTYNSTTGLWSVGALADGARATLTLRAMVASPSARTNTASISHSDQFDPLSANNADSATETPQQADLAVSKIVSNPTPNVGDTISFTVAVTDIGPDAATNVRVADPLPPGLAFVSAVPGQGTYSSATGTWAVGTLAKGAHATLTLYARVIGAGAATNVATISHADQFDPVTTDNSASVTETPQQADLQLSKSVSNPTPNVGDMIAYTVTVANSGRNTATNVVVSDLLPPGLALISAVPSQGAYNSANGLWTVGTLAKGARATLNLQVRVVCVGTEINTATISHSDQFDPDANNNVASVAVMPQVADLIVVKAASPSVAAVGGQLVYTLIVANRGPATAVGVALVDPLPAGVAFVGLATTQGFALPIGHSVAANLGNLAPGAAAAVVIVVTPEAPGILVNSAVVGSRTFDPNPSNNTSPPVVTPVVAPPTVLSLLRFGFHAQPTTFVLAFSAPLDPARAQNPSNYTLMPLGPNGQTGAPIPIVAAVYNPFTLTVTLYPNRLVYLFARYRLVVNGSTPTGLAGTSGVLIDGAGNGVPGTNYVRDFGPEILAGPNPAGAGPAVATSQVATSALAAPIRSSATPQSPSPAPSAPTAIASRGYGGMTAWTVNRALKSFRNHWKGWM
jgi:uncharacterized repeat protein (TIGR01451 family)